MWTVKGYAHYVRGVFETENTSDDDLDEYHLGGMLTADVICSRLGS
ncbi:hypothetical protein [Desulfopila sp. IMCC35008]|nr:hypothetical protein [Desulfopila sp. IMCC35008]